MEFALWGDDSGIVPQRFEVEDIVQPDLCLLVAFLYKDGVLSQAMFEEVGFPADVEIVADALDGSGEAVAGNGFDEEVECSGFEGVDGVVGIGGDEDAGVNVHEAGAELDAVEAGHVDIEEKDIYGAGQQEFVCLVGVIASGGDPDKRVIAQVCGHRKPVYFVIVGDKAGQVRLFGLTHFVD
jgi:hypothetical protein